MKHISLVTSKEHIEGDSNLSSHDKNELFTIDFWLIYKNFKKESICSSKEESDILNFCVQNAYVSHIFICGLLISNVEEGNLHII